MTAAPLLVGCALHDGADIDACGCPALDSPGAIAYRGLLVKARAEIARITAELDAARAVPADVTEALHDYLAMFNSGGETLEAGKTLRTAIARAISDATDKRDAEWQKRIAPLHPNRTGDGCDSGDPIDWTFAALMLARIDVESDAHDEGHRAAMRDATAARGTVGGLLATAPVDLSGPAGSRWTNAIEWVDGETWFRIATGASADGSPTLVLSTWCDGGWGYEDENPMSIDACVYALPARLVPAAEADADPNQRGPLPTAAPRCSCTHEAGDSICDAHPSCSECGDSTSRNVDDCADHCQVCASLRRGDAITDWTATCQACKSRGPLPKGG